MSDMSTSSLESDYSSSNYSTDSNNSQENNIDLNGDIINNYNIITELGRGAYSIVWLGFCISDSKYYAIKVQNPDDYSEGKDEVKMLKKIPSRVKYINRLVDYFVEERFVNDETRKFICSVYELCCGNLDVLSRKGKYKNGYPLPIAKEIFRQICEGLNVLHNDLKVLHGDIKPDNILLCGINKRDEKYIEWYNKADFLTVYSQIKKQYWIQKGNDIKNIKKMDPRDRLRIRKELHKSIIFKMDENKENPYHFDEKYIKDLTVKITDFGTFCPDTEVFEEEFGTRYYQAPEIILMGDCTKKVDIWALGCTLYELVTSELLFDPHSDRYHDTDFYHLEMMIKLCGRFSKDFIKDTQYGRTFFDKKCRLKEMQSLDCSYTKEELSSIISNKLLEHNIDDKALTALIVSMLQLLPYKRVKIQDILGSGWLTV